MFTRVFHRVIAPFIVWALTWSTSIAQNPAPLVAVFPRDGDVDVSTHVTFTVASYKPLDMTTLTLGSVLIIEDALAQRLHRSQWARHSTLVQPVPQGSTLFSVTPHGLNHDTRYRCLVTGLSAIITDPGGSVRVEPLPPLETTFTTAPPVPEYVDWSVDASAQVHCHEQITLRYSTSLERYQPMPPDIVTVERADPAADGGFAHVPIDLRSSSDGRSLTINTREGWAPGSTLRIKSNRNLLTGNPIGEHIEYVRVRSTGTLVVRATNDLGGAVPSDVEHAVAQNSGVIHAGHNAVLSVPPSVGAWQFVRWSTDELTGVDGNTAAQISVPVACSELSASIHVNAVYELHEGVDIAITTVDNGTMELRTQDMALVKRISADTTIHVSRTEPLMLMAIPAQGYQFTSWSSTMAAVNASTNGTVLLGGALIGPGASQYPPAVNPVFIPVPGSMPAAELYRLRGDIVDEDQDALHPVDNGVAFTTEREFESAGPGLRMLCVTTTSRNWEITGYAIASTGQTVRFPQPQREACVAAELEHPLNIVTFYARRTPLSLRVERVLLKTDDITSIIRGKDPHHEARVAIDVQEMFRGTTSWREIGLVTCRDDVSDIDFRSTVIKAGDMIRLRTTDATRRAQAWETYAPVQAYLTPGASELQDGWYTTTTRIDRDHARFATSACDDVVSPENEVRVRACWRQQFGIDAIALRVLVSPNGKRENLRFEERWLDPLVYQDLLPDEPRGGRQLEYLPGYGTSVKVRFTGPVDVQSVLGGAITMTSEANTLPSDPLMRGLDFTTTSGPTANTNFEPRMATPSPRWSCVLWI